MTDIRLGTLSAKIKQYVREVGGSFSSRQIDEEVDIRTSQGKSLRRVILKELCDTGIIERIKGAIGVYRPLDIELKEFDWQHADTDNVVSLRFPFELEKYVKIYPKSIICLAGGKDQGKGHPVGTPILTPLGWKRIESLEVGEEICHPSGQTTRILGIYNRGKQDCYRFIFNDQSSIEIDKDHLWKYQTYYNRDVKVTGHGMPNTQLGKWRISSTQDIVNNLGLGELKSKKKLMLPPIEPLNFYTWTIPLDPYLLGLLLGDGCFRKEGSITFTTSDNEILTYIQELGIQCHKSGKYDYRLVGLTQAIYQLGLRGEHSWEKFVPNQYLWNDKMTRLSVLQGLLDTDGTIEKIWGGIEFDTTSYQLAKDTQFLVQSLGGIAVITSRISFYTYKGKKLQGRKLFRVKIRIDTVCPFRLERKKKYHHPKNAVNKLLSRIEAIGQKETICLKVDNPDGLYIAKDFIVTHNTAWLYDFTLKNMFHPLGVDLYNSETGREQMKERMQNFKVNIPNPAPFRTFERYDNFADVIDKDRISVIDYLDLNSEVYLIGDEIDKVFRKLDRGIAVIGLQKPPPTTVYVKGVKKLVYRDLAYGSGFTAKRAVLYISLDNNVLKLVVAKTPLNPKVNPTNMMWVFWLKNGAEFIDIQPYEEQGGLE